MKNNILKSLTNNLGFKILAVIFAFTLCLVFNEMIINVILYVLDFILFYFQYVFSKLHESDVFLFFLYYVSE